MTAPGTRDIAMNEIEKKIPDFIKLCLQAVRDRKQPMIKIISFSNGEYMKKNVSKNGVCFFLDCGIGNNITVLF